MTGQRSRLHLPSPGEPSAARGEMVREDRLTEAAAKAAQHADPRATREFTLVPK